MSNPNKKNDITELVLVIDRSGSMAGLEADTIGGINAVLEKNRALPGKVLVSTVLFDHESKVLHDRESIDGIPPLTTEDYQVRGCTALLDAVGGAIKHISRVQRYLPESHRADKVIFVITTDGQENSSHKYSYDKVKKMVEDKTADGWEFIFLGANIDVAAEATRFGIQEDRLVKYAADPVGTNAMYESVAAATCAMRSSSKRIGGAWRKAVEKDMASRG